MNQAKSSMSIIALAVLGIAIAGTPFALTGQLAFAQHHHHHHHHHHHSHHHSCISDCTTQSDGTPCSGSCPILLWKVGQSTELIKTPTYKGDVVSAACTVIADNDVAKTFQLGCHEQTQLPAGANSTNPQHLDLTPVMGTNGNGIPFAGSDGLLH